MTVSDDDNMGIGLCRRSVDGRAALQVYDMGQLRKALTSKTRPPLWKRLRRYFRELRGRRRDPIERDELLISLLRFTLAIDRLASILYTVGLLRRELPPSSDSRPETAHNPNSIAAERGLIFLHHQALLVLHELASPVQALTDAGVGKLLADDPEAKRQWKVVSDRPHMGGGRCCRTATPRACRTPWFSARIITMFGFLRERCR
jgi:hypothetical protein